MVSGLDQWPLWPDPSGVNSSVARRGSRYGIVTNYEAIMAEVNHYSVGSREGIGISSTPWMLENIGYYIGDVNA